MSSVEFQTREGLSPSDSTRLSIGGSEVFEPSLNQLGAIGSPIPQEPPQEADNGSSDSRAPAPPSRSHARSVKVSTAAAAVLQQQQAEQQQQISELSQFVRHLGSQLEVLVTQATARGKGKGKARNSARAQQEQEESSDSEHDHDSNEEGGNNDEGQDGKALDDEDYVSHAFYRQHIEDGFEKRAPPKLSLAKPFYYPIDDAVTRTLAASKYTSKLAEYTLSV